MKLLKVFFGFLNESVDMLKEEVERSALEVEGGDRVRSIFGGEVCALRRL